MNFGLMPRDRVTDRQFCHQETADHRTISECRGPDLIAAGPHQPCSTFAPRRRSKRGSNGPGNFLPPNGLESEISVLTMILALRFRLTGNRDDAQPQLPSAGYLPPY